VPGSNQSVIIKHGNYRTVYSNLATLYVKVGDKVSTKQKIGKVYTDTENDNKTELYFMLYKDTEIQNPEIWLAK
jgi:murein DD-endopeptidase MepM/ murein hydrolase activator NlpD